jgi:hypothetical protein
VSKIPQKIFFHFYSKIKLFKRIKYSDYKREEMPKLAEKPHKKFDAY